VTATVKYEFEYRPVRRKDGSLGRRFETRAWPYSPINVCERCGVIGGLRRVTTRNDVFRWNAIDRSDWSIKSMDMLCVSCWNVARAISVLRDAIEDLGRLARKLDREASYAKQG
jgi:hypothetical protein